MMEEVERREKGAHNTTTKSRSLFVLCVGPPTNRTMEQSNNACLFGSLDSRNYNNNNNNGAALAAPLIHCVVCHQSSRLVDK